MSAHKNDEQKLRIAQIAPLWASVPPTTYGGIELIVKLLTEELVARGHDVTLFGTADSKTSAKLHATCETNVLEMMVQSRACTYEYYANASVAEALANSADFDVMHFHIGCPWIPFGAASKTPALFTIHTLFSNDDEWALQRYPRVPIAAISQFQVAEFARRLQRQIPVVYNGCDFDAFEPRFERGEYVAFLGRMSEQKNPLGAIQIAQAHDLPIVLAGKPQQGSEEVYFAEKIKPLIDGKNVRWVGPVNHPQKMELLRNAAALIFPVQWAEPFGLVMIEAMACGTPVVAHNLGSVAEVVDQGVTGYHAPSIEAMAELVPAALALDRRAVREHAAARFSHQRMVDGYLNVYRDLISPPV